jgi:hypothetical protein
VYCDAVTVSLINVDVNALVVDTCTVYEVAPAESFQFKVGVQLVSVSPLDGLTNIGGLGTTAPPQSPVVKCHTEDHPLVPYMLVALTRQ